MVSLQAALLAGVLLAPADVVLLDFTAAWCGPCRQMAPVVQRLVADGYPVRAVDIDQHPDLASRYGVTAVPCFVLVAEGRELGRIVGPAGYEQLAALLKSGGAAPPAAQAPVSSAFRGQSPDNSAAAVRGLPAKQSSHPLDPDRPAAAASAAAAPTNPSAGDDRQSLVDRAMAASVRLRIEDRTGRSVGSGTIIDARDGEALVLTCGHVFRDWSGQGPVTVDLFGSQPRSGIEARVIGYNLKADIGLVSFKPGLPVSVARVASRDFQARPHDEVVSVGCSHGADPTARVTRVTAVDKFLGPPNIQVAGQPVQGRSGGGLFNDRGQVIGVCNAADPADNEGLFAALGTIYSELDRLNLTAWCTQLTSGSDHLAAVRTPPVLPRAMPPVAERGAPDSVVLTGATSQPPARLSPQEAAVLEVLQSMSGAAEIICIVRPLDGSQARSEVIHLDRASGEFLRQLAARRQPEAEHRLTSLHSADTPSAPQR